MKIIFLTREGYDLPGARVRCYNFARELGKYGVISEVISFSDTLGAKDGKDEGRMPAGKKIAILPIKAGLSHKICQSIYPELI